MNSMCREIVCVQLGIQKKDDKKNGKDYMLDQYIHIWYSKNLHDEVQISMLNVNNRR